MLGRCLFFLESISKQLCYTVDLFSSAMTSWIKPWENNLINIFVIIGNKLFGTCDLTRVVSVPGLGIIIIFDIFHDFGNESTRRMELNMSKITHKAERGKLFYHLGRNCVISRSFRCIQPEISDYTPFHCVALFDTRLIKFLSWMAFLPWSS